MGNWIFNPSGDDNPTMDQTGNATGDMAGITEDECKATEVISITTLDGIAGICKPIKFDPWDDKKLVQKSIEEVERIAQVGDCIFLWGKKLFEQGPQMFQNCNVAHVVQVYEIHEDEEKNRKISYIESSITGTFGRIVNGVQKHDDIHIALGHFQIAWYIKLNEVSRNIFNANKDKLILWHELQLDKNAKYSVFQAVSSVFSDGEKWPILHGLFYGINKKMGPTKNSFFCSGLIAAAFVQIGIIKTKEEFKWNLCTPREFLKLDIWEDEVIQFFGYEEEDEEGETVLLKVPPLDSNDFKSMTSEEWNEYVSM